MNKDIEHIFGALPSEKHYVPNTISEIAPERQNLNVTAGQNANWTYANFFILEPNSPINSFNINEGQFVVAYRNGSWGIWDFENNQVAKGLSEIQSFVNRVTEAENLRLNYLDSSAKDSASISSNSFPIHDLTEAIKNADTSVVNQFCYLRAMRTKPFLLLAGISGTGKSRIVKQMAFDSCPDGTLSKDTTSPGNYCLIEVKPNWHDSTELLGYKSLLGGEHYEITPFIKFIIKAMMHKDVPFFVCLDEMNLAPVEQYFAEFLSVLESRKKLTSGEIVSEPIIKADAVKLMDFKKLFGIDKDNEDSSSYDGCSTSDKTPHYGNENAIYDEICEHGIRLPQNLIVIGTVNMDETTHQFSRKVIDRAMTIEMNLPESTDAEGNTIDPFMNFFNNTTDLEYKDNPESASLYIANQVKAADVIEELNLDNAEKTDWLKGEVAKFLNDLNAKLNKTPFKVAYRVQNELLLYFYQIWLEDKSARWRDILNTACDQILMMKVLPRIEGDEELLEKPLEQLLAFCEPFTNAHKKVKEMSDRLTQSRFTSFWP